MARDEREWAVAGWVAAATLYDDERGFGRQVEIWPEIVERVLPVDAPLWLLAAVRVKFLALTPA
ncbi:hypothetical protein ACFWE5_03915 [Cellulosimicrobium funkei]|uniref:hypothetical protein n=1 Tax=Cellulosimicrobium funkei TaxID=264251 RepID=UPI003659F54E